MSLNVESAELVNADGRPALRLVIDGAVAWIYEPKRSLLASLTPRPPSAGPKVASEAAPKDGSQTLWLLEGGQPRALRVTVLGSNGQVSEVRPVEAGSPLAPGAEVIVEAVVSKP